MRSKIFPISGVLRLIALYRMKRMIKKGLIRTAKVGHQYRILGKELLRLLSPKLEDEFGKMYNQARNWVRKDTKDTR